VSNRAQRQRRKAAQAAKRDAELDERFWAARAREAKDPVSRATFERGAQAARSRRAEAEREEGWP
jgi:hypothetical protein